MGISGILKETFSQGQMTFIYATHDGVCACVCDRERERLTREVSYHSLPRWASLTILMTKLFKAH